MAPLKLCVVVLGASTLLFLADGASESGSSIPPPAAVPTPASITDVSSLPLTINSTKAPASSSLTAGTPSANDQSPLPDPPLRLPGKRRNRVAGFSKSLRKNSKDNLNCVLRILSNAKQSVSWATLHVTRIAHQCLRPLFSIDIVKPLLDALASPYDIAYDSLSAAGSNLQGTSQTWITAAKRWADTQMATSTQWVQSTWGWARDELAYEWMRSTTEVGLWPSNKEDETWWSSWLPIKISAVKSPSTLGLLQVSWSILTWGYQFAKMVLYVSLALAGVLLVLVVLCPVLWELVMLKRAYRWIRGLWDQLWS